MAPGSSLSGSFRNLTNPFTNQRYNISTSSFQRRSLQDVPLEDIPRRSTETTRRNGYRQSKAPERATRIIEDIKNGNYSCSICSDPITAGTAPEYTMWHCDTCCSVFHYRCIKSWSRSSSASVTRGVSIFRIWKCPYCQGEHTGEPIARCWCKRISSDQSDATSDIPNACLNTCGKVGTCTHEANMSRCAKTCHPGPCSWPCKASCANLPPEVKAPVGCCDRLRRAWHHRKRGDCLKSLLPGALFAILYALFLVYLVYDVKWSTQQYNYSWGWMEKYEDVATPIKILGGMLYGFLLLLLGFGVFTQVWKIWSHLFDSGESRTNSYSLRKALGGLFLGLLALALICIYVFGLIFASEGAWYNQMKDSCQGLNTRVWMDLYSQNAASLERVIAREYTFHSLENGIDENYYLGAVFDPKPLSNESYQYFHRFSGGSGKEHYVAVDVDLYNNVWRLSHLNDTDKQTKWSAKGYTDFNPRRDDFPTPHPRFQPLEITVIKNGTFENPTDDIYMTIPELDLWVANMWDFTGSCNHEPFLRVFNMNHKTLSEKQSIVNSKWTNKNDDSVVMRTTSFGHGRQRLDMCVRQGNIDGLGSAMTQQHVPEDLLVPFAIIAVTRLRVRETAMRGFGCAGFAA